MHVLAMKLFLVLTVVTIAAANHNHYDSKYDNFNVEELVKNMRLLKAYTHCFIGDGKCTPEGNDIKKWIPESSLSECAKCTEKQKIIVAKFIKAIQEKLPKEWEILSKQNDPEGTHKQSLQKFVDEYFSKA